MKHFGLAIFVVVLGVLSGACFYSDVSVVKGPSRERDRANEMPARTYSCHRATSTPVIDGKLDDPAWKSAAWSESFVDISGTGHPTPRYNTRMKMLWDDSYLYIGAKLDEPHVWATLRKHDDIVFNDNDFEVFIDPDWDGKNYFEIETNALGTVFDLMMMKKYKDGGPADHGWDAKGMKLAVYVDGTLNDPRDADRGWSVEMALPWSMFAGYVHGACPPKAGDAWAMNFSRVEWQIDIESGQYFKKRGRAEDNWVWRPTGEVNMHLPDRWGKVIFRH